MWGSFSDRAKQFAEKAKAAAADLDKQLNESVGVETTTVASTVIEDNLKEDEALNDAWADDFDDDAVAAVEPPPPQTPMNNMPKLPEQSPAVFSDSKRPAPEPAPEQAAVTEQDAGQQQPSTVDAGGWNDDNLQFDEVDLENSARETPTPVQPSQTDKKPSGLPLSPPQPETSAAVQAPSVVDTPEASSTDPSQLQQENDNEDGWAEDDALDVDNVSSSVDRQDSGVVSENDPPAVSENESGNQLNSAAEPESLTPTTEKTQIEATEQSHLQPPKEGTRESAATLPSAAFVGKEERNPLLEQQVKDLQDQLRQREDQLISKTEQLTTMQALHESEKRDLMAKVQSTKEEAKRRIQKARERVEASEEKLKNATAAQSSSAEGAAQQAEVIAALRQEGENLARKQSEMEQAVRAAKSETRDLRELLDEETKAKERALEKIEKLETELKSTKESLTLARKGESQATKLETELQQSREETEVKAVTILNLEQQVKERKQEIKDLKAELESARKGAAIETQREQKKLRKEHNDVISDLEAKLRTSERDAGVREDALRHEVAELRKRWQDAVRRADSLSMDVQSSTAPLLRQLESTERQNRVRASAWAELETKLRSELEETVIANEKLSKERSDWKTKYNRLDRTAKENEEELKTTKTNLEEKTLKVKKLEEKLQAMETEEAKMKEEWAEVERLANEGVARVRSEMTQTVVDSEERFRSQLESLEKELQQERQKRSQLEAQVDQLLENVIVPPNTTTQAPAAVNTESKPKRLRQSVGQVEILAGALNGLGGGEDEFDEDDEDKDDENGGGAGAGSGSYGGSSFAALEELRSRLKVAKVELTALRKSLEESEKTREKLVEDLAESRNAKEKLPLFEAKVAELTEENRQQSLEIRGLQEDITDVRELYRTQLNVLLEEKAATAVAGDNSSADPADDTQVKDAGSDLALEDDSDPKTAESSVVEEADPAGSN